MSIETPLRQEIQRVGDSRWRGSETRVTAGNKAKYAFHRSSIPQKQFIVIIIIIIITQNIVEMSFLMVHFVFLGSSIATPIPSNLLLQYLLILRYSPRGVLYVYSEKIRQTQRKKPWWRFFFLKSLAYSIQIC